MGYVDLFLLEKIDGDFVYINIHAITSIHETVDSNDDAIFEICLSSGEKYCISKRTYSYLKKNVLPKYSIYRFTY